jgi:hypothetical protein
LSVDNHDLKLLALRVDLEDRVRLRYSVRSLERNVGTGLAGEIVLCGRCLGGNLGTSRRYGAGADECRWEEVFGVHRSD